MSSPDCDLAVGAPGHDYLFGGQTINDGGEFEILRWG